jgi:hypothetical protein
VISPVAVALSPTIRPGAKFTEYAQTTGQKVQPKLCRPAQRVRRDRNARLPNPSVLNNLVQSCWKSVNRSVGFRSVEDALTALQPNQPRT